MSKEQYSLGFDIGGTKCATVLGRNRGAGQRPDLVAKEVFATSDYPSPEVACAEMSRRAMTLVARHAIDRDQLTGLGISCGGPLNSASGLILSPPNLPGWDQVPVVEWFETAWRLPARLQNDANACALAEWQWGAARGVDTAIFLTFGTGMGAGLIIDGRLHAGKDDLAGEVGHWRMTDDGPEGFGKKGSFEGWCSGGGMTRFARQRIRSAWAAGDAVSFCSNEASLAQLDVRRLSEAARTGDALALEVFRSTATQLGKGLAVLVDVLNPEAIVIGSIFARCEDLLRPTMTIFLKKEALSTALRRCQILPSLLGENIGDYASLAVGQIFL